MSQSLATSFGHVPNILRPLMANHGTLVLRDHKGHWHYFGKDWRPYDGGLTNNQFIRLFHKAPPSNVPLEGWGIVPGLTDDVMCRDANWTKAEVQAALDSFVESVGVKGDGESLRALTKAEHLGVRATSRAKWDRLVTKGV